MPIRTILVGSDGSPGSARAVSWATVRAKELGSSILAVHVLTYSTEFRRDLFLDTITTWRRHLESQLRGPWTAAAREAGVEVRTELVEDDTPAAGLLRAAAGHGVDLVVLGATTYKVSHAANIPVVIVPAEWQPSAAA